MSTLLRLTRITLLFFRFRIHLVASPLFIHKDASLYRID
jgi:hypothetical protein